MLPGTLTLPVQPDGSGRLRRWWRHLAAVVVAAGCAQVMRPLQLAAIRAFGIGRAGQRVMRPPHITARRRDFFLWNGHLKLLKYERTKRSYLAKIPPGGNSDGAPAALPGPRIIVNPAGPSVGQAPQKARHPRALPRSR